MSKLFFCVAAFAFAFAAAVEVDDQPESGDNKVDTPVVIFDPLFVGVTGVPATSDVPTSDIKIAESGAGGADKPSDEPSTEDASPERTTVETTSNEAPSSDAPTNDACASIVGHDCASCAAAGCAHLSIGNGRQCTSVSSLMGMMLVRGTVECTTVTCCDTTVPTAPATGREFVKFNVTFTHTGAHLPHTLFRAVTEQVLRRPLSSRLIVSTNTAAVDVSLASRRDAASATTTGLIVTEVDLNDLLSTVTEVVRAIAKEDWVGAAQSHGASVAGVTFGKVQVGSAFMANGGTQASSGSSPALSTGSIVGIAVGAVVFVALVVVLAVASVTRRKPSVAAAPQADPAPNRFQATAEPRSEFWTSEA